MIFPFLKYFFKKIRAVKEVDIRNESFNVWSPEKEGGSFLTKSNLLLDANKVFGWAERDGHKFFPRVMAAFIEPLHYCLISMEIAKNLLDVSRLVNVSPW